MALWIGRGHELVPASKPAALGRYRHDAVGGFVSATPAAASQLLARLRSPSGLPLNGKGKIVQCRGCLANKCKECVDNKHRCGRPPACPSTARGRSSSVGDVLLISVRNVLTTNTAVPAQQSMYDLFHKFGLNDVSRSAQRTTRFPAKGRICEIFGPDVPHRQPESQFVS